MLINMLQGGELMKRCQGKVIEWYWVAILVVSFVVTCQKNYLRAEEMDWIAWWHAFHLIICPNFEADTVILFDSDWNPQASSLPNKNPQKSENNTSKICGFDLWFTKSLPATYDRQTFKPRTEPIVLDKRGGFKWSAKPYVPFVSFLSGEFSCEWTWMAHCNWI